MKPLDEAQTSDFIPYLGHKFHIRVMESKPVELELISVEQTAQKSSPPTSRPFSLHFLGPASSHYLVQHIYRLEHEQMGVLDLFLVPLGSEAGRMRYEAVFN